MVSWLLVHPTSTLGEVQNSQGGSPMQDEKVVPNIVSDENDAQSSSGTSRRGFLKTAGLGAAALTASALVPGALAPAAEAREVAPFNVKDPDSRARQLEDIREDAARAP